MCVNRKPFGFRLQNADGTSLWHSPNPRLQMEFQTLTFRTVGSFLLSAGEFQTTLYEQLKPYPLIRKRRFAVMMRPHRRPLLPAHPSHGSVDLSPQRQFGCLSDSAINCRRVPEDPIRVAWDDSSPCPKTGSSSIRSPPDGWTSCFSPALNPSSANPINASIPDLRPSIL
eukprot:EG_transcript_29753